MKSTSTLVTLDEAQISTIAPTKAIIAREKSKVKHHKVAQQPGFVLHSYPYKETSLIIEVFSRDFGRVALVAKGAKRPFSHLRSVLQTFQPLNLSWTGKGDIPVLMSADWVGGMLPLEKSSLLSGFYLNELIIKFLLRSEPNSQLFDQYVSSLNQLAHQEPLEIVLRRFEIALLRASGLIPEFKHCTQNGKSIIADQHYSFDPMNGVSPYVEANGAPVVLGKTLLDMAEGDYADPNTRMQSKILMRYLLSHHLHGGSLKTRQILIDLHSL
jgi:DNA repair protein RecO (recombination protein O)